MTGPRLWFGGPDDYRPGDVFDAPEDGKILLTEDRDYARQMAANVPLGTVYRVEPVGDAPRDDGHALPTYAAQQARVVAVVQRAVQMTPTQRRALLRRWTTAHTAGPA